MLSRKHSQLILPEYRILLSEFAIVKILYNNIKIIGSLGILEYKYLLKKNIFLYYLNLYLSNNNLLLLDKYKNIFFSTIHVLMIGVTFGWYTCFNIFGRGFSFKLRSKNNLLYLKLKIGYSHFIYYQLPSNLFIKISRKRNKLFIFSLDFWIITKIATQLRNLRSKHTYKIQGILFYNEKFIVKPGKKKQT